MTRPTWQIIFESYLVLGTAWLLINLVDRNIRQKMTRVTQRFRPWWTEAYTKILVVLMFCIFMPLTVYNTLLIFGILQ